MSDGPVYKREFLFAKKYEGQHGFRPGYSRESQVVTVCQDIADSMDEEVRIEA